MANAHDFAFTRLTGEPLPFKEFAGRTVLVVNTASACGYTPQYEELEKLWQAHKEKGLVVLGVPCNQFGGQEPGTEDRDWRLLPKELRRDLPADGQNRRQRQKRASLLSMGERGSRTFRATEMEFPQISHRPRRHVRSVVLKPDETRWA